MRRTIFFLSLLLACGPALAEDRILVVAISQYENVRTLPGVERDQTLAVEFFRLLGYEAPQIMVLADDAATYERIVEAIDSWLVRGTGPGDRAIYYHSGHGALVRDVDGDEGRLTTGDATDEVLLTYDSRVDRDRGTLARVLLDDDIGRLLGRIPAREVVVLVDSCHSGTVTRSFASSATSKYFTYEGSPASPSSSARAERWTGDASVVLLSAAGPGEEAQTSKEKGSLFTRGIHAAARRAASRRRLTLEELRGEAESYISEALGSERERKMHTPALFGDHGLRRLNLFRHGAGEEVRDGSASWTRLEILVRDAAALLEVRPSRTVYDVGESLGLSVTANRDGYLQIVNVGDGEDTLVVLYPNRFQSESRVTDGETVEVPEAGRFVLPAGLPPGRRSQKNLVAVFLTAEPLDLAALPAAPEEAFKRLRQGELTRSIQRTRIASGKGYAAGQVVVTIEGSYQGFSALGRRQRDAGDAAAALRSFEAAFEATDQDELLARAAHEIARTHRQSGQTVEARSWLRRSLGFAPDTAARRDLRELELAGRGTVRDADEIVRELRVTRAFGVASAELRIHFELNRSTLDPLGRRQAAELGEALRREDLAGQSFLLLGHTDRLCPPETDPAACHRYNLELSERRAETIERFLVARYGLSGEQVRGVGCGRSFLLSRDGQEEDHYLNRRVVVVAVEDATAGAERLCGRDVNLF